MNDSKPQPPIVSAVISDHWVKVSSQPPTFYPRGVAADCPTDYQSGEWVETGDERGTRYFIPFTCPGRIPRQDLIKEAMSARSPMKLQRIKAEDRKMNNERVIEHTKSVPLIAIGTILSLGFCPDFLVDTQWKEEWNSSKRPGGHRPTSPQSN